MNMPIFWLVLAASILFPVGMISHSARKGWLRWGVRVKEGFEALGGSASQLTK